MSCERRRLEVLEHHQDLVAHSRIVVAKMLGQCRPVRRKRRRLEAADRSPSRLPDHLVLIAEAPDHGTAMRHRCLKPNMVEKRHGNSPHLTVVM